MTATPERFTHGQLRREAPPSTIDPVSFATRSMGGRLVVHLDAAGEVAGARRAAARGEAARGETARREAARTAARIGRWADRLSRHREESELNALNADPRREVPVRPTLSAALQAARRATDGGAGFVDVTLLDARLAAEGIAAAQEWPAQECPAQERPAQERIASARDWTLLRGPRGSALVRRAPGIHFDLGGVAKGWIADRALALLAVWPSAVVDADGDLAVRCAPGRCWTIGIDDPRAGGDDAHLAILQLSAPRGSWPRRWGVATSGTSVHRWAGGKGVRHHLIDPRTGQSAVTDVVQATVVCGSALEAEALAKAAVIAGSVEGLALLERSRVNGAVILTEHGEVLALPGTLELLAPELVA